MQVSVGCSCLISRPPGHRSDASEWIISAAIHDRLLRRPRQRWKFADSLHTSQKNGPKIDETASQRVAERVCEDPPRPIGEVNPEIPDWLEGIIGRLLEKEPDCRFANADAVAELLSAHLAHLQSPSQVPTPHTSPLQPSRVGPQPRGMQPQSRSAWLAPIAASLPLLKRVNQDAIPAPRCVWSRIRSSLDRRYSPYVSINVLRKSVTWSWTSFVVEMIKT
jgi:hypothetical protein